MDIIIRNKKKITALAESLQEYSFMTVEMIKKVSKIRRNKTAIIEEMYTIGTQSLFIVVLGGLFVGIILALEVGYRFEMFGAKTMVGRTVSLGILRELGPVISGLLLAARTGSKNTSEIGSMKLSEQLDAMRAFGTDPVEKLVLPRMLASVVMFLPLTLLADFAGIVGGMFVSSAWLSLDKSIFWNAALYGLQMKDLYVGFSKPIVFGFFISTISCFMGMKTSGGTTGLGRSVINSVVTSSIVVLIIDFIFTKVVWEIM